MISDMENGEIGIIVTKDLSRLGRNQLHTGLYIEERFPMFGVRYIAINDNVDTASSESNDLMPFKNLFNEWFIRDTSRKIRAVLKAKAERGERLGTRTPYGYRKDPDTKKLIVDDEAATIVRRIFAMCAGGSGPSQIARILKKEQILTPTMYAYTRYGITHTCLDTAHPYNWSDSAIANLLENEIYLGNTVNMKYSTKTNTNRLTAKLLMPPITACPILGSRETMNESVSLPSTSYPVFALMIPANSSTGVMMAWGSRLISCNLLTSIHTISEMGTRKHRMASPVISSAAKLRFIRAPR